ncbi:MAG: hypothetical protein K6G12_09725, partial [Lachnospiraceae bacterium]|nr:hypothetical protein [Lachnospiraceae bacterium]
FHIGLLGECYINGLYGFPICEKTGFQYLVKAAQKGEAIYMREVGTCLINGTGIEKSIKTGLSWFIKASKAGCASAKVELGKCYEYGLFNETPRDFQTAQAYYTQAIALGDRDAEYLRLHLWLTQGNNPTNEEAKDSLIERMRSGDLRAKDMLKNYAREIKHYRWYLRIRLDMIKDMVNRWTADRRLSRYSCLRIGGETR